MLDAFLSRIGSFGGGDAIWDMSDESDVVAPTNVRNGKVCVAAKIGLHLDEIGPARN